MQILKVEDLTKLRENIRRITKLRKGGKRAKITVHMGTCGIAAGAGKINSTLLDIVEENMSNPDKCVSEAGSFIKENIKPLLEATKRGRSMVQSGMYEDLSEEEARRKLEEMGTHMSQSGSMEAIERFTKAFGNFSMKYPRHGEKISDVLSEYQMQFE